nr:hypothetical protein [Armatimonadota bacterium]
RHHDPHVWFAPHYEHRMVLGRLLFWADIRWFRGTNIFLIAANFVMAGCSAVLFWCFLGERLPRHEHRLARVAFALLISGWVYLLCQGDNLTGPFQGVFSLAYLLPLAAFYCLYKSAKVGSTIAFVLACTCGVLACGSMANGTLALPLMALAAILIHQSKLRIGTLIISPVVLMTLYFRGLSTGNSAAQLIQQPAKATLFVLGMLGSPFTYLLDPRITEFTAWVFGALFVLALAYKAATILSHPRHDLLQTCLLFFVLYVGVSAVGIAAGRISSGTRLAFSGTRLALIDHYATPTIMGWAALLTLYSADIVRIKINRLWLALSALVFAGLMINLQTRFLGSEHGYHFQQKFAALALALGVRDEQTIALLGYPPTAPIEIPPLADEVYPDHISVFGMYPFRGSREQLHASVPAPPESLAGCKVSLHTLAATTDPRFISITGWIYSGSQPRQPVLLRFMDGNRVEVGAGITGGQIDAVDSVDAKGFLPGFSAYVATGAAGKNSTIQGEDRQGPVCRSSIELPAIPFSIVPLTQVSSANIDIDSSQVRQGNAAVGKLLDVAKLDSLGLHAYGTFGHAITAVSLNLKRGDRLLYRSSSAGPNPTIRVNGLCDVFLPLSSRWLLLDFSNASMPVQPTRVEFLDGGPTPNGWLAVAVRNRAAGK